MDWRERNRALIEYYGIEHQKLKLCEECAEVIQAILKGDGRSMWEGVADVEVLVDQLKLMYDVNDFIRSRKRYKITRQLVRIKDELARKKRDIPEWLDKALEGIPAKEE